MSAIEKRRRALGHPKPTRDETLLDCDQCDASLQTRWRRPEKEGWVFEPKRGRGKLTLCCQCKIEHETIQTKISETEELK